MQLPYTVRELVISFFLSVNMFLILIFNNIQKTYILHNPAYRTAIITVYGFSDLFFHLNYPWFYLTSLTMND